MKRILCVSLCNFVTIMVGLNANSAFATNSTLSMSIDNTTISLDITPRSINGDFAKSNNSTISVITNNYSGYTLSITASSSTNLINTVDSSKVINSITSATSESDFSANTTTSATNYNGKWGYLPSKFNSIANTAFQPSPGTGSSGHTLDITNVANSTANTYTLAIGARVDNSTTPGIYSNSFVISAVANLINYSIIYNKGNTTDTVTNLPANTNGTIADPLTGSTSITLSSTVPTRSEYDFIGWCTVLPSVGTGTNPDACSDTTIQPSGTYNLNAAVNPNITIYAMWQKQDPVLYNKVAAMSKGTQTLNQLRTTIAAPTSSTRISSNSGVYEYNTSVFGSANDADSTHTIYYYRGILDSYGNTGAYGSDGLADAYPNYVILQSGSSKATTDTCWRIVRTTGSGGVKMIYNGKWTGSTCANVAENAQVTTQDYDITAASNAKSIVGAGYTYNASYKSRTTSTAYSTLFGSNTSYSGNTTNSTIKNYIEGTWFNDIRNYETILEPSAGYCNDRSIRTNNSSTSVISNSTSISTPYTSGSSATAYYFGSYVRNTTTSDHPTLACPRNNADLYTTAEATDGNKQLSKPAALLTADESALAGSGEYGTTTPYHKNSFLNSGTFFWLLSPHNRNTTGSVIGVSLGEDGDLRFYGINFTHGVRPVISLKEGTEIASGAGTATDPWVVEKPPKTLYQEVAEMSKGTQTLAQLRAAITVPTSADRTQDTSNSGVYEYNSSVFGTDSDATKSDGTKATIYYYRGVLENSVGSYGSDGSAVTYPNYVILDADGSKTTTDTCWRIVRTTGSGGVKMIYNGKWTGTTCANATTNAQVTTRAFNATSNIDNKSIIATGYTFNPSYKTTTDSTAYSTLFGSNTSYSGNSTNSTIKSYIENVWFTNINSYSSMLEPSAGYCNDRTIRSSSSSTSVIGDSTSISTPYTTATSGVTDYYFGVYVRTRTTSDKPTLGCPRTGADLYTTSSTSNGNKQLSKLAALITADEAAFAGSGYSSSTTPYHANSYLRSGSTFWLLSPYRRASDGRAYSFALYSSGGLSGNTVHSEHGVRPAISLTSGTTIASGSGTATDPWVVTAP